MREPDPKNSVLGELLVSLIRAPEHVQEAVLVYALKQMQPMAPSLIQPYPMLSHMNELINNQKSSNKKAS